MRAMVYLTNAKLNSYSSPVSVRELIFLAAFAVWLFANILFQTSLEPVLSGEIRLIKLAALAVCVACELVSGVRYGKDDLIMIVFIIMAALSAYILGNTSLFQIIVIIFCCRIYSISKVLTCFAWTVGVSIALIFFVSTIGLIESSDLTETGSRVARSSMGFVWPSRFPTFFFAIAISYVCVKKEKSSLAILLVMLILNYFIYIATDSRNPFLITALFLVFVICKKLFSAAKAKHMRNGRWLCLLIAVFFGASIIIPLLYNPSQQSWLSLDSILARRLFYSSILLENVHPTLFGLYDVVHQDTWDSSLYGYFDSGYLLLFFGYGIISSVFIIGGLTCVLIQAYAKRDFYITLSVFLTFCFSLFYPHMFIFLCFSPMMFYIPRVFSGAHSRESIWIEQNCISEKKEKCEAIG